MERMDYWIIKGHYKNSGKRFSWRKKFRDVEHAFKWKIKKNKTHSFSKFHIDKEYLRGRYNSKLESNVILKSRPIHIFSCVYALISKGEVVYIGQSLDIMGRLSTHMNDKSKKFDSYAIVEKIDVNDFDLLLSREKYYISELKPKYNKTHNPAAL